MAKQGWYKRLPWIRLLIIITAILIFSSGALLWILDTGRIIQGGWSYVLPPLFTVIGIVLTIGAWLFPFSQERIGTFSPPFARELVRESFRMGDDIAATFPYVTTPIEELYHTATQALRDASNNAAGGKYGILILGEANAGKTRLAFEVLTQTLPDWRVLVWRADYTISHVLLPKHVSQGNLLIFIDNLQEYASIGSHQADIQSSDNQSAKLLTLLSTVRGKARCVVVVATCRTEDEGQTRASLGWLFEEMALIRLSRFKTDDPEAAKIIADFQMHGPIHVEDWDGTLGSLVLGLSRKLSQYEELVEYDHCAVSVLRAMKLLTLAGTNDHTEQRIQGVCAGIFGERILQESIKAWRDAIDKLTRLQFVTEERNADSGKLSLVIRKDTYFDKVVTDYRFIRTCRAADCTTLVRRIKKKRK